MTEFLIERLGAQGDGIAETEAGPVFLPFTLPGERVEAQMRGDRAVLERVLSPSPERVEPPCPHFGVCGGCSLQHMSAASYAVWKRQILIDTLAHRGFSDLPVAEAIISAPGSRRRAGLKAERLKDKVILGFSERQSHRLVDVTSCPVLRPEIVAFLGPLRAFLRSAMKAKAEITVTLSDRGLDVALSGVILKTMQDRMRFADFAESADLARLTVDGETVLERRVPMVTFGDVPVPLPSNAFLQATKDGEAALQASIAEALAGATKVVDLFAGLGTFSFPLAATAAVHAVEGDAQMVAAFTRAAGARKLVKVTAETRDLFRNPLRVNEFKGVDAVVMDPPRAGAQAQTEMLAQARVPRLALVSCNPGSFARDARVLVDVGYEIDWIRPVDQFLWSPHLELVASFVLR
ncbi:class I SAM-dependent RNA methyltransferase [Govanella unica]|uniref:Class I SAM-dependent RNA methyltransferase n=1 Tax=Govanella unica TaxID=2975056 RepID=A0A9X3TZ24_9PROT|nr:class I SAM-dependent RNA methyltransferase [Govania unica]MDA5194032.1 class I SAM-dependent RNA methyltransferase [Govania unica]